MMRTAAVGEEAGASPGPQHRPPPPPTSKPSSSPLSRPPAPPVFRPNTGPPPHPAAALHPGPSVVSSASLPTINLLEKLIKTCPVWLQLGITQERSAHILTSETPGIFLVRRDGHLKTMLLAVRLLDHEGAPQIQELAVKEEKSLIYLDGSVLVFDNIFKLIAFYCVSRDILPFTLRLPQVIAQATRYQDMEVISSLGSEFWGSSLNCPSEETVVLTSDGGRGQSSASGQLWYINPIFIEEHVGCLPPAVLQPVLRTQSLNVTGASVGPQYKRPPPLPPRPLSAAEGHTGTSKALQARGEPSAVLAELAPPPAASASPAGLAAAKEEGSHKGEVEGGARGPREERVTQSPQAVGPDTPSQLKTSNDQPQKAKESAGGKKVPVSRPPSHRVPPVPRRRLSEKQPAEDQSSERPSRAEDGILATEVPVAALVCLADSVEADGAENPEAPPTLLDMEALLSNRRAAKEPTRNGTPVVLKVSSAPGSPVKKPGPPVPPPRRKKRPQTPSAAPPHPQGSRGGPAATHEVSCLASSLSVEPKTGDVSLYSPDAAAGAFPPQNQDNDSYSTSSTEEEADPLTLSGPGIKRTSTVMLDRAKQRLSMVHLSNVFTGFMCGERKLQNRVVELGRDCGSYFGNLVRDHRAFALETMSRHGSSTEMLQEIRQMMTQLKSYLIQSAEMQNLQEPGIYSEEKLEVIIEAALCKCVLKPLKEAVYSCLKDIYSRDGMLKTLRENQHVLLGTTTTDLGVTTSIPEAPVMEKIQQKLATLHQEYSPQKKIDLLLKTCKMIYDSMSVSSSGKTHGADDFLPVLIYVLARSNLNALLLDVEYMMELMDPALQLGEGSYYLTTTYGALEHIKNYDKQPVTRQLSLEVQDSIHRWERRRTLNKARASSSSVQDFISVSFLEAGSGTKTLGVQPNTSAQELCSQCADKFEVPEPGSYCLTVLVDGQHRPLAPDELPLAIKSGLHHSEPRREYCFIYRPAPQERSQEPPETSPPPESLI
ncbi:LOW QUALITY PROTEIN: ras and Rab interactor 3-like [Denticeps clupeoides]|uniref:LOW QUALITY PROTEIN: ras and Rab interactor 3-like n=1 Tax=Denticeps clupeoides TaxID=299321 RepID=UPI0010A54F8C|nr:LOW QUALITY PROTEIN: ras and Rab interactor 3-like [Denticeps clupeoides]